MKKIFSFVLLLLGAMYSVNVQATLKTIDWKESIVLGYGSMSSCSTGPDNPEGICPVGWDEWVIDYNEQLKNNWQGTGQYSGSNSYLRVNQSILVNCKLSGTDVLVIELSPSGWQGSTDYGEWNIRSQEYMNYAICSDHTQGGNMGKIKEIWYQIRGHLEINITNTHANGEPYAFYHKGARVIMTFMDGASLKINGTSVRDFTAILASQVEFSSGSFETNGRVEAARVAVYGTNIKMTNPKDYGILADFNGNYGQEHSGVDGTPGDVHIRNATIDIKTTGIGIYGGYGLGAIDIYDSQITISGPAAGGAMVGGPINLDGCSITSPEGAAVSTSPKGICVNGSLTMTLTIEPERYDLYIKGVQVNSNTHSTDFTYIPSKKELHLYKDIITTSGYAIETGINGLTIISEKDSLVISGKGGIKFKSSTGNYYDIPNFTIYSKNEGAITIKTTNDDNTLDGISLGTSGTTYYHYGRLHLGKGRFYISGTNAGINGGGTVVDGSSYLYLNGGYRAYDVPVAGFSVYGLQCVASAPTASNLSTLNGPYVNFDVLKNYKSVTYSPKKYDLWIGGTQITGANCTRIGELPCFTNAGVDGVIAHYSEATNTLTFETNIYLSMQRANLLGYAIESSIPDLTIDFQGNSYIIGAKNQSTGGGWSCIRLNKNTTITGSSYLDLEAVSDGIGLYIYADQTNYANSDLTVLLKDIEIITTGYYGIGGTTRSDYTNGAVVVVDNATISATTNGYNPSQAASIGRLKNLDLQTYGTHEISQPENAYFWLDNAAVTVITEENFPIVKTEVKITPIAFDLWVGGTQVTGANRGNIKGSGIYARNGKASFNPITRTLTLNNCQISNSNGAGIESSMSNLFFSRPLHIVLEGNNSMTGSTAGITSDDELTISGPGSLGIYTSNSSANGISMTSTRGNLTITEEANVLVRSSAVAVKGPDGKTLTVNGASLTAKGATASVSGWNNLTLSGGCEIMSPKDAVFNQTQKGVVLNDQLVTDTVTIMPAEYYDLRICGTRVKSTNCSDLSVINGVTGTVSYDPGRNVLTLENATLTTPDVTQAIWNQIPNLKIVVKGACDLNTPYCIALRIDANTTIEGSNADASLKVRNAGPLDHAIGSVAAGTCYAALATFNNASLTVKDCEVETEGAGGILLQGSSQLTVNHARLTALSIGTPTSNAQWNVMRSFKASVAPVLVDCELLAPEGVTFSTTLGGYTTDGSSLTREKVIIGIPEPEQKWENGVLPGKFSVSATKQVYFSQGNLQYKASTNTWRFANAQSESIIEGNANISPTYNGWIDLFGWGTANHPTDTSKVNADYLEWVDWGANAISNGGNEANLWRTMTSAEYNYLFNERNNADQLYSMGVVKDEWGMIVLPDDWTLPEGLHFTPRATTNFYDNRYYEDDWAQMEAAGAVFLPDGASREGTVIDEGSTLYHTADAVLLWWRYEALFDTNNGPNCRWIGCKVRLVQDYVNPCPVKTSEFSASAETSYTWNSETYTESGDYTQTFPMANGCDSIVTLHLTITGGSITPVGAMTWRADDEDIKDLGTIVENTTIRGLTFVATADKAITVDANTKSYDTITFTHRIKLNGTMAENARHLKFDVTGDATIEIYAMASSSSVTRQLNLAAGTYNSNLQQFDVTGDVVNYIKYDYTGNPTTIFIGSANSGINLLGIVLTPRDTPTAIDNTPFPSGEGRGEASKLLLNNQVFILRDGKYYTILGVPANPFTR